MAKDYIPASDAEFRLWESNFNAYTGSNAEVLGLVPADIIALAEACGAFDLALTTHIATQQQAAAHRQAKDEARAALEEMIRSLVRRIQANPAVTDTQRQFLGITVKDAVQTKASAAAVSASRPLAMVDTSQRLRHEIRFVDEATPTSRAKPKGTMGCEIWVKVGTTPPTDPSECAFVALDTASPYIAEYPGSDAGKTAYYMLRWVNTHGDKGAWSETAAATITA